MRTQTQTPTTPAPASPTGLKKVSFGRLTTKRDDKTTYPQFPDTNGQAAIIAARIIERTEQLEALKGGLETDKAELKQMVSPFYFTTNHGRAEIPSSVAVHSPAGEVLVTYQNRYSQLPDESALTPLLGDRVGLFFRQCFEIKIVGDKLPEAHAQELLDGLQELFARFNCLDALEVKAGIKPTRDFHTARHQALTPEQNMAVEQICPIIAMIKTKGRR